MRWLDKWFVSRAAYEWVWRENDRLKTQEVDYEASCERLIKQRDEARKEYAERLIAMNELAANDMRIMAALTKERDDLQAKHNTLIHAINDAAMVANDFSEVNQCGSGTNNRIAEHNHEPV